MLSTKVLIIKCLTFIWYKLGKLGIFIALYLCSKFQIKNIKLI